MNWQSISITAKAIEDLFNAYASNDNQDLSQTILMDRAQIPLEDLEAESIALSIVPGYKKVKFESNLTA